MSLFGPAQVVSQDTAESSLSSDTDSPAESSRTPHRIERLREALWEAIRSVLTILGKNEDRNQSEVPDISASSKGKGKRRAEDRWERPAAPWIALAGAMGDLRNADVQAADARGQAVYRILQSLFTDVFRSDRFGKEYRAALSRTEARGLTQCQTLYRSSQLPSSDGDSTPSTGDSSPANLPKELLFRLCYAACSPTASTLDLRQLSMSPESIEELPIVELLSQLGLDTGGITRVQLDSNGLTELPRWVLDFRSLRSLSLNYNPHIQHLSLGLLKLPVKRIHAHKTGVRSTTDGRRLPLIFYSSMAVFAANQRDRRRSSANTTASQVIATGPMSLTHLVLFRLFELDYVSSILDALPPHLALLAIDIVRCELCGSSGFRSADFYQQVGGRKELVGHVKARWGLQEFTTGNRKYSARELKAVKEVIVQGRLCGTCRRNYLAGQTDAGLDSRMSNMTMRFHP